MDRIADKRPKRESGISALYERINLIDYLFLAIIPSFFIYVDKTYFFTQSKWLLLIVFGSLSIITHFRIKVSKKDILWLIFFVYLFIQLIVTKTIPEGRDLFLMMFIAWIYSRYLTDEEKLLYSVIISLVLVFINMILQYFQLVYPIKYDAYKNIMIHGNLGHSNYASQFLIAVLTYLTYYLGENNYKNIKIILPSVILTVIMIIFTKSRGGMLVALIIFSLFYIKYVRKRNSNYNKVIIGISLLAAILLISINFKEILSVFDGNFAANKVRILVWRDTISMFLHNILTGVGIGNFPSHFPYFWKSDLIRIVQLNHPSMLVENAHNEYLTILAETGVIGFILFLIALFFSLNKKNLYLLIPLLIYSLFDYPLRIPVSLLYFFIFIGIGNKYHTVKKLYIYIPSVILATYILLSSISIFYSQIETNRATIFSSAGKPKTVKYAKQAVKYDSLNYKGYFQWGLGKIFEGDPWGADKKFDKCLEIFPTYFSCLYNKAALCYNMKKITCAYTVNNKLLEFNPYHPKGNYLKAIFYANADKFEEAKKMLEIAFYQDKKLKEHFYNDRYFPEKFIEWYKQNH